MLVPQGVLWQTAARPFVWPSAAIGAHSSSDDLDLGILTHWGLEVGQAVEPTGETETKKGGIGLKK